ncbi:MAG: hypothetical protein AAF597_09540 [Bacteroidota bacterium]
MSTFRERLLPQVSTLCAQLFAHRLTQVREQQLVSDKAKTDLALLVLFYEQLFDLEPFPAEPDVDVNPLNQLKADLATDGNDHDASEVILLNWVRGVTQKPDPVPADEKDMAALSISPINQRMLDATARLRSTIDKSRSRLLLSGDHYDRVEYVAARNAFTLARATYDRRLQTNGITATVDDCAKAEGPLHNDIDTATGASFPGAIQAAADFMEARIFVIT